MRTLTLIAALVLAIEPVAGKRGQGPATVMNQTPGVVASPPAASPAATGTAPGTATKPAAARSPAITAPAPASPPPSAPGTVGRDGMPLNLVPAGECVVGDDHGLPGEKPARRVFVPAFVIDRYEVSNAQYRQFLDWVTKHGDGTLRHPDQPAGKDHTPRFWKPFRPSLLVKTGMAALQHFSEETFRKDDLPVVGVDWYDAYAYSRWAGRRLPSEDEWEKAARGTDGRTWPWGNAWDFARCNSGGYEWKGERDGYIYAAPVTAFERGVSPYGCYNMAGNVWEWVEDRYDGGGTVPAPMRVVKGGGSNSYPSWVRPAARQGHEPDYRYFCLGFRCAADVPARKAP